MNNPLAFDTETTGFLNRKIELEHVSQPHICQLAAILYKEDRTSEEQMNVLIKPDGWVIPEETTKIHGISNERANDEGVPMRQAIEQFNSMKERCTLRIAYNIAFDKQFLLREELGLGIPHATDKKPQICVMEMVKPICKMPPSSKMQACGMNTFKNPKLSEAYQIILGKPFENAHDAMNDVLAMMELYHHLTAKELAA